MVGKEQLLSGEVAPEGHLGNVEKAKATESKGLAIIWRSQSYIPETSMALQPIVQCQQASNQLELALMES